MKEQTGTKKPPLHATIVALLTCEREEMLDEIGADDQTSNVAFAAALVANSHIPDEARPEVAGAFILAILNDAEQDKRMYDAVTWALIELGFGPDYVEEQLKRVGLDTDQIENLEMLHNAFLELGLNALCEFFAGDDTPQTTDEAAHTLTTVHFTPEFIATLEQRLPRLRQRMEEMLAEPPAAEPAPADIIINGLLALELVTDTDLMAAAEGLKAYEFGQDELDAWITTHDTLSGTDKLRLADLRVKMTAQEASVAEVEVHADEDPVAKIITELLAKEGEVTDGDITTAAEILSVLNFDPAKLDEILVAAAGDTNKLDRLEALKTALTIAPAEVEVHEESAGHEGDDTSADPVKLITDYCAKTEITAEDTNTLVKTLKTTEFDPAGLDGMLADETLGEDQKRLLEALKTALTAPAEAATEAQA